MGAFFSFSDVIRKYNRSPSLDGLDALSSFSVVVVKPSHAVSDSSCIGAVTAHLFNVLSCNIEYIPYSKKART